ncbi:TolC family protein [Lacinutrix gracilariae]|uniref:TolC family protein n=1 Tax=Lacinutrix gracilariae TaxID=1747198 RepID=A0ABW5K739_9FLAO
MKKRLTLFLLCFSSMLFAQEDLSVLRFDEYLAFVKKYHPIAKQAQLVISESEAKLLKARGAFDPKLALDYNRKKFKGTEYYDKLNTSFKIPTWYGIELKANFEEADGVYLNPESTLPEDGLYSAGISFSVAQGLLINKRMASLKQAKLFKQQAEADRDIIVNNILFEASLVYFNWLKAYNEVNLYQEFLANAQVRFNGIKQNVEVGESAAIDAVEARIVVNERALLHEKAKVKFMKATLELSNYLWLENNIPVELQDNVIPNVNSEASIDDSLNISELALYDFDVEMHPKVQSLSYKYESLKIEKRLKANMLLPKIDLQYNFLSQTPEATNSFNTANYKSGVTMLFPLFLRKERGDLKLAKLKMKNTSLDISLSKLSIKNKVDAIKNELQSYVVQNDLTAKMIQDYQQLVAAEERKFTLGESSLFLVNARERKLMDARLKAILLENSFFETKAKLFNNLAVSI